MKLRDTAEPFFRFPVLPRIIVFRPKQNFENILWKVGKRLCSGTLLYNLYYCPNDVRYHKRPDLINLFETDIMVKKSVSKIRMSLINLIYFQAPRWSSLDWRRRLNERTWSLSSLTKFQNKHVFKTKLALYFTYETVFTLLTWQNFCFFRSGF